MSLDSFSALRQEAYTDMHRLPRLEYGRISDAIRDNLLYYDLKAHPKVTSHFQPPSIPPSNVAKMYEHLNKPIFSHLA